MVSQSLILGDVPTSLSNMDGSPVRGGGGGGVGGGGGGGGAASRRSLLAPPPSFCSIVVQLIAMQILALGVSPWPALFFCLNIQSR